MTPDLTREDAFAWMARTGNGALRAARHFAGENASDSDVKLIHNRIKQWKRRAKPEEAVDPPTASVLTRQVNHQTPTRLEDKGWEPERAGALAALAASVDRDGVPAFGRVAKTLGIGQGDLWRWWRIESAGPAAPLPIVHVRSAPDMRRVVLAPNGPARDAIGQIQRGGSMSGLNKGQFSLLDILMCVLDSTGPAHVVVAAWTSGRDDAETLAWLVQEERIRSLMLLTDRSFPTRAPRYAERVLQLFGPRGVVCTKVHAKFLIVQNAEWNVVVRASMNFNTNPRLEQFDIDDCADMAAVYAGVVDEICKGSPAGLEFANRDIEQAFHAARMGAEELEDWERAGEVATRLAARLQPVAGPPPLTGHSQIAASGQPLPEIPDVDPATESRVDFYSRRLRDVETWIRLAATTGRSTLLASMLRQQSEDRKELDEAIEEAARERAHAERAKVRDPEQIAASILDALPALLGVCTDATRGRFIDALKQTSWMEPEQIDVDSDEE